MVLKKANDKSPSWTGVEFLYKFLINNKGIGPFAKKCNIEDVEIGDIIQLSFDGIKFSHTLFIVGIILVGVLVLYLYVTNYKDNHYGGRFHKDF